MNSQLKLSVRIESRAKLDECQAFLDGVAAALIAMNQPGVVIRDSSARDVNVEISLKTNKRVRALAASIAVILEAHCSEARVTLVADVPLSGEGAA